MTYWVLTVPLSPTLSVVYNCSWYNKLAMDEGGENLTANNPENVTSSFASRCKDTAKYIGVGVPVQVGLMLVTNGIIKALTGSELEVPVLTAVAGPGTMMITKSLLNRPE